MSRQPPNFQRPQRPGRDQPEKAKGRRYNPLLVFGIAAFAVVALYLGLLVVTQADQVFLPGNEIKTGFLAKLPGIDSGEDPESADIEERINILVLGLDRLVGAAEGADRADTVFVLTVDPFSKTAGVFSIPRDLVVEIPDGQEGYFQNRINVAYEYGQSIFDDYPGGGPGLAIDTIEHNFGIPIDHYAVIDFEAFIALIDEVGGVDIDVPQYVADFTYADCPGCSAYAVEFFPGLQHMDGRRALAYVRIREGSSDLDRIDRQQLLMQAVMEKALGLNLFGGFPPGSNALSLYNKYKDAVDTDISDFKIPGLAELAKDIDTERLKMVSLGDAVDEGSLGEASVLYADWDKVEQLKNQVFLDGRLQAEAAVIQLQNGTDDPELATQFAEFLAAQGLSPDDIVVADVADGQLHRVTKIYNLNGKGDTAATLARWLDLPDDRIVDGDSAEAAAFLGTGADVVVVLGTDANTPEAGG